MESLKLERFRDTECVRVPKVDRVKTLAQKDVQALPGEAPVPRRLGKRAHERIGGAIEFSTKPLLTRRGETEQIELGEERAAGTNDSPTGRGNIGRREPEAPRGDRVEARSFGSALIAAATPL